MTERVCTACHGLGPDITAGRTPAAWKKVVEEMVAMGAQGSAGGPAARDRVPEPGVSAEADSLTRGRTRSPGG